MKKKDIIIFCGHYLPGFKAGGILKAVSNIVFHLKDKLNIHIITRDHDLGENKKYDLVESNKWNLINNVNIFYQSKSIFNFFRVSYILYINKKKKYFFNSFF